MKSYYKRKLNILIGLFVFLVIFILFLFIFNVNKYKLFFRSERDFSKYQTELSPPSNCSLNEILISTPLQNPVNNINISCGYGYRIHPITGKKDFHTGIDIAVPENTDIYSALGGKVKEISENRIYGKYIIIAHDNDFETIYCHCNDIFVKKDMNIRRGERIGKSGNTGLSTGPHLHFEIKYKGKYYNPEYLL